MSLPPLSIEYSERSPQKLSTGGSTDASKLRAKVWKERERIRLRVQIRLQKDCGYDKRQADIISSEILKLDKSVASQWRASEPSTEVILSLANSIEKRWAALAKRAESTHVKENNVLDPIASVDSIPVAKVSPPRHERSDRLKNHTKDIWTSLMEAQLSEAAQRDRKIAERAKEDRVKYVSFLKSQMKSHSGSAAKLQGDKAKERVLLESAYAAYLQAEKDKESAKVQRAVAVKNEQQRMLREMQVKAKAEESLKLQQEMNESKRAADLISAASAEARVKTQLFKAEMRRRKEESDRLAVLKQAQQAEEAARDIAAQKEFLLAAEERESHRSRKTRKVAPTTQATWPGQDDKKTAESEDTARLERERVLAEEERDRKKAEDAVLRAAQVQAFQLAQVKAKQAKKDKEIADAAKDARRLAHEVAEKLSAEDESRKERARRNMSHRLTLEGQMRAKAEMRDVLDETPVEIILNRKALEAVLHFAPPDKDDGVTRVAVRPSFGRKLIPANTGTVPASHYREHVLTTRKST